MRKRQLQVCAASPTLVEFAGVACSHQYLVTSSLAKLGEAWVVNTERSQSHEQYWEPGIHKTQIVVQHLSIQVIILNEKNSPREAMSSENCTRVRIDTRALPTLLSDLEAVKSVIL